MDIDPSLTTSPESTVPGSYWLFQYTEGENRPSETASPGEVVRWKHTRYKGRIRPGDVVFVWRAGRGGGLKGWGVVTGESEPAPGQKFNRIPVTTRANFGDPIPRDVVRRVPEVSDLGVVMQGRQGTNFPVSTEQAYGLVRLIEDRGFEAPRIPEAEIAGVLERRLERDLPRLGKRISQVADDARQDGARRRYEEVRSAFTSADKHDPAVLRDLAARGDHLEQELELEPEAPETSVPSHSALGIDEPDEPEDVFARGVASFSIGVEEPCPPGERLPEPPDDPLVRAWKKKDRIGIDAAVTNLARYIAHQDLVPPRAIGIFGDWGSGKTFFMNALESEIALLAWRSRQAREQRRATDFCGRVVQIEFNAWHYVESNLWASLAGHIFEKLHAALASRQDEDLDVEALFAALETFREANRERDQLAEHVRQLGTEHEETRRQVADTELSLTQLRRGIVAAAGQTFQAGLGDDDRKRLAQLLPDEEWRELRESSRRLDEVLRESRGLPRQISLGMTRWGRRQYVLAIGVALLLVIGVPAALTLLDEADSFARISAAIGGYLTSAAGVLTWLAARGRGVLETVGRARQVAESALRTAEDEKRQPLRLEEEELARARGELARAEEGLRAQRQRLEDLEARVRKPGAGARLKNFLEERVRDRTYQQHLGLISLVRKDFEYLSQLMEDYWSKRTGTRPFAVVRQASETGGDPVDKKVPFIERIVLYIDDLDRCPTGKVVEVLQAVHLLLGFKLFVVVVGVDVRWVGQSLLQSYPSLLEETDGRQATSGDYLEKIFQIPFRIPPMNDDARERFVSGLITERFLEGWDNDDAADALAQLDLKPRELTLYPAETECINELHPSLGRSPRRVKRFIDVYRLMRAGMDEADVEYILSREHYRSILAQFALLSGSPQLAPRLLPALQDALLNGLDELVSEGFAAWFRREDGKFDGCDESETASARAVFDYLDAATGADKAAVARGVLEWMPEVVRYSFREVRLRET